MINQLNTKPMSKFDQYSQSLNTQSSQGMTLYTGQSPVKVLAINPNLKQLEAIIGDVASKFDTTYAIKKSALIDKDVRPVVIWVTDKENKVSPTILGIDLCKDTQTSSTGKVKVINDKGQDTWAESVDTVMNNPKMSWFSHDGIREAKIGEVDYYKFLSQIMRFNFKGDTNFIDMCKNVGIDFDSVYNGNFAGLYELVEWLNTDEGEKMPNYVIGLCVVKKKDDGKLRQELLNNSDTWYRCPSETVLEGHKQALIKLEKDKRDSGYSLTNRLYTYEFQEFNEQSCINSIPAIPKNIGITEGIDDDWLS